ncbi:hypothetical protein DDB_G0292640 [Dictyostelium discoideum AX4]|uniref:MIT domain-containing protein n=1 Tax=Dictyostelium discoideum TaxID=44689 RepID=Q54CX7_DICDI|nr:hypothetical protein DDB_G0292640 [Dictyostelium discoideum AX4]EAL61123.1 hypothetical protein DDB_G0292640 [Dictyostelium discoideum AX4]|eukprot:XP_629543.1 hypothetical protein DDB_G0292640 [Dictyostelium discoideum AX4]
MSVSLQSALELVQKAVNLDNNGKAQEAISMYSIAIDHLRQVCNSNIDQSTKNLIDSKILEYQNRSNFLKSSAHLDFNNNNNISNSNSNITFSNNNNSSPPPFLNSSSGINNNLNTSGTNLVEEALKYANEAVSCESKNNFQNAIIYYRKCSELLEQASKNENDIETRLFLNQKKQEYQSRADTLEKQNPQLSNSTGNFNNNNNFSTTSLSTSTSTGFSKNNLPFPQAEEEYSIMSQIQLSNSTSELIDLAIDCVKEAIKEDDHLNYEKAIHYYDLSVNYFQTALTGGGENNPQIRQLITEKMINSKSRSQFLKNKIQYKQNLINNEYDSIPLSLRPGQKYKDPVRKKTVLERLSKTIKGPKNISDHWL